ncbi:MAG: cupin domain-containing protein [Acidobacteria bacterium]|nr:cupin domain-containing protein [Acidobacteriota bacterium]
MKTRIFTLALLIALPAGVFAAYQNASTTQPAKPAAAAVPEHVTVAPSELKWTPLFLGLESAVVSGDPAKAGAPFIMRVRARIAAAVPAHWHPQDENVTVLAGSIKLGMGDKYEEKALHALTAGSYTFLPKTARHFVFHAPGSVIQVHGTGPFELYFVNPAEDPRKPASK